jgi:hypothetical protein
MDVISLSQYGPFRIGSILAFFFWSISKMVQAMWSPSDISCFFEKRVSWKFQVLFKFERDGRGGLVAWTQLCEDEEAADEDYRIPQGMFHVSISYICRVLEKEDEEHNHRIPHHADD